MEPTFPQSEWVVALEAWKIFVHRHPELAYKEGLFSFHNFLRRHVTSLKRADAIRLAKNKFWIAHRTRFVAVAFECATGAVGTSPGQGELVQMPVREASLRTEDTDAASSGNPKSNQSARDQALRASESKETQ